MKNVLFAFVLATLGVAFAAAADAQAVKLHKFPNSHHAVGHVISSVPVYKSTTPGTKKVCEKVQVPIYAHTQPQAGDVVAGMVVGGVAGKILTGKDSGAAIGAVLGGAAAANSSSNRIVGYRIERQCHMVEVTNTKIKHYESRVRLGSKIYRVKTGNQLSPGGTLDMWVAN